MKKDYTRDFNDIEYFIDHVSDIKARIDVLQKLGYKIGVDVVTKETDIVKKVIVGKRGELRIQIAPAEKGLPLAKCVILE
jgi:hypothetical protein